MACDNNQIIQALEAISALNGNENENLEVSKLKHLLDQTKTSKTTPSATTASNNQEISANTASNINIIAKNNSTQNYSQPKLSPRPKSSSISTVDLVSSHSE